MLNIAIRFCGGFIVGTDYNPQADFNESGKVDWTDYQSIFAPAYGRTCP